MRPLSMAKISTVLNKGIPQSLPPTCNARCQIRAPSTASHRHRHRHVLVVDIVVIVIDIVIIVASSLYNHRGFRRHHIVVIVYRTDGHAKRQNKTTGAITAKSIQYMLFLGFFHTTVRAM
jgi:hypothetical protein